MLKSVRETQSSEADSRIGAGQKLTVFCVPPNPGGMNLPQPIKYFPVDGSRFEVGPRLKPLGQQPFFQFDTEFGRFRENKLACRKERLSKYLATYAYSDAVQVASLGFIVEHLLNEYPNFFSKRDTALGIDLECHLTGETICFDRRLQLLNVKDSKVDPPYVSAFDALCCQFQEDFAVTEKVVDGRNWVSALHLCAPSHWAAEDKIGKDFRIVHAPVPGIEKMNRTADQLVDASIHKGPYTRFVFLFSRDNRLNHHLEPSPGYTMEQWTGAKLDFQDPCPFYLRVERQVVWGLPAVGAFLFSIHIYFTPGQEIRRDATLRRNLCATMHTMPIESLRYKGLKVPPAELIAWLES